MSHENVFLNKKYKYTENNILQKFSLNSFFTRYKNGKIVQHLYISYWSINVNIKMPKEEKERESTLQS